MNTTKLDPFVFCLSSPILMSMENVNFCVGLPLNICVIIILTRGGGLDGSLIFALSQIAAEILFAMAAPLFILCYVDIEILCFSYPISIITATCMVSRFMFQCCVCFERYVAVVYPLTFLKYKAIKYRLGVSGFMWIYSFICGAVSIIKFSKLFYCISIIFYIISISIMLFFSFSLLRSLKRPGPGVRVRDDGRVSSAKKKALKIVSLNVLIFLIQTVAVTVSYVISYTSSDDAFALSFFIALNIITTISLMQPFLFLYQNGKLTCSG